jgi:hypothetical protein
MRLLLFLAAAVAVTAEYVPGRAFDRFFTIWLENQVCPLRPQADGNGRSF